MSQDKVISGGINLEYVIDAYRSLGIGEKFFTSFFDKLMGTASVREMIMQGKTAAEIKASWRTDDEKFCQQRRKYLLYKE